MIIRQRSNYPDLLEVQRNYILTIGRAIPGIKALILDNDTTDLVAPMVSQSEAQELGFFLIEKIDSPFTEELLFVIAVYIIKCSSENVSKIFNELAKPHFKEYHFFFVSDVEGPIIRKMAEVDYEGRIRDLSRIYINFSVHTPTTFSPPKILKASSFSEMQIDEETLVSLFCALKKSPTIRFNKASPSCAHLADKLQKRLKDLTPLFSEESESTSCVLLLLDRRDDLLTPLLIHWSYLGLLHDLFDFKLSKISIGNSHYNLSLAEDEFYRLNIFCNYGDLALNLRRELESLTARKKRTLNGDSFEEMQKIIGTMPELRKESSSITKHFSLANEISKHVNDRKLMQQSQLEQEMATKERPHDFYRDITSLFGDSGPTLRDKFRLLAIFFIRFSQADEGLFDSLYNQFFSLQDSHTFLPLMTFIKGAVSQNTKTFQLLAPLGGKAVQLYKEIFSVR